MTNILLGLVASVALAASGSTIATKVSTSEVSSRQSASAVHVNGPVTHTGRGVYHSMLTKSECTQLGGSVDENKTCGGTNQQCTTVTQNPVTHQMIAHTLCLTQ